MARAGGLKILEFTLLIWIGSLAAGLLGALTGLGGGVVIVPLLALAFGVDMRYAVGASLVSVIATSSGAAAAYLREGYSNIRLGMFLELFTATGALVGGLAAFLLPEPVLAGLFAMLLLYTATSMLRRPADPPSPDDAPAAPVSGLAVVTETPADASVTTAGDWRAALSGPGYRVHDLGLGVAGSLVAGVVSALLGIGGGIIKVPLMHLAMGVPLRAATATSNLMIGVTASASAIIYLLRGGIDPFVAGPTALGVFIGATVGSRTAQHVDVRILRILFVIVLLYTAAAMARRALGAG